MGDLGTVGHVTQSKMFPAETLPAGLGRHPWEDPFDVPFGENHYPDRWEKAGSPLAGPFTFVLDGIQGDQDFVASLFSLKRTPADTSLPILRYFFGGQPEIMDLAKNAKML